MARRKKNNSLQIEGKEVVMSESSVMDSPVENKEVILDAVQVELDLARLDLEKTKLEIAQQKHELELMKRTSRRELDPDEQKIYDKGINRNHESTTLKNKIDAMKARDSEMVTGKFMNRRAPGQGVKLPYVKHDTDPVKWYPLEDGKVYTIPRGFADQLNGGTDEDPCYYTPQFTQIQGEMDPNKPQSAIHHVDSSNKKYAFVPVNF